MSLSNSRSCPFLMPRFRNFPGCGDLCVGYIYGIFDYGWEFKLDGGGHVVGCLQHRRDQLLAIS